MWIDELYSVQHAAELADGAIGTTSLGFLPTLLALEFSGVDMAAVDPREWWTWRAAGITEWGMRGHVALLGAVSVFALGLTSRRIFTNLETALLCLLIALSPWHLWMSQVSRFYVQLFLFYNLGILLYFQATEYGKLWHAVIAMICVVLAFYTTPIALMIVIILCMDIAASWLRRQPTGMRGLFWGIAALGLALRW
jgi:hypothetical protein